MIEVKGGGVCASQSWLMMELIYVVLMPRAPIDADKAPNSTVVTGGFPLSLSKRGGAWRGTGLLPFSKRDILLLV